MNTLPVRLLILVTMLTLEFPLTTLAGEPEVPKIRQLRCGSCPDGFATTAVTNDPTTCKDGDPTLVQCAPLGEICSRYVGIVPRGM